MGLEISGEEAHVFPQKVFNYLLQFPIQEVRVQKQVEMRRFAGVRMRVQEIGKRKPIALLGNPFGAKCISNGGCNFSF